MKGLNMKNKLLLMALALVFPALTAAQPPTTSVAITTTPGVTVPLGIIPTQPANPANTFFYDYTVTDGESITDAIPVTFCYSSSTGTWTSFNAHFNSPAGSFPGVTVPGDTLITPGFTCATTYIQINTGVLTLSDPAVAQEFASNINIQTRDKEPNNLNINNNFPTIHIRVRVTPAEHDTACFMTDSSGNLLMDCSGAPVTQSCSNAGRFAITVNNKKNIEVSTNPGQFYYNILWTNRTGAPQVVNVGFAGTGVDPKGANAIHAYAFPPSFSGVTPADFQIVNDGIPGGSDGVITGITVPAGWTLWANDHVEWAGIGNPVPAGIATTCDTANQVLSVTGTLSGAVDRTCTAGALGYKK